MPHAGWRLELAGDGGFEPPLTDPESAVLPLDQSPTGSDYQAACEAASGGAPLCHCVTSPPALRGERDQMGATRPRLRGADFNGFTRKFAQERGTLTLVLSQRERGPEGKGSGFMRCACMVSLLPPTRGRLCLGGAGFNGFAGRSPEGEGTGLWWSPCLRCHLVIQSILGAGDHKGRPYNPAVSRRGGPGVRRRCLGVGGLGVGPGFRGFRRGVGRFVCRWWRPGWG